MDKDYFFLRTFYMLLKQGYGLEETLLICEDITRFPYVDTMIDQMKIGMDVKEIIMEAPLPTLFLEFFDFFSERFTLALAIKNSLDICDHVKEIKKQLRKDMTYPLMLIVFMIGFSIFATTILFPKVSILFDSFSVERPFLLIVMIYIMKMIPILFIVSFIVITFLFLYLLYALKNKKYLIIEKYLKVKGIRVLLQKYFTLKFAVYFNELLKDHIDAHSIMKLLNEKMNHSDIKIMIYEIYTKMNNGLSFEEGMYNLEYFDPLFILMYKLFLQSPQDVKSLQGYIDLTLEWVHVRINKMVKIVVPAVYSFVAIFVISIYLAAVLPLMNIIGDL